MQILSHLFLKCLSAVSLWPKDEDMKFRKNSTDPYNRGAILHMNGYLCFQMDNIYTY